MISSTSNGRSPRVGLLELPGVRMIDQNGKHWSVSTHGRALVSKKVLMPQLQEGGFEVGLVNLKKGDVEETYGQVDWNNGYLVKLLRGGRISDVDPNEFDAWGITVNLTVEREAACMAVEHLSSHGKPVVVGGSDALAVPDAYFKAGATAIVQDKSGASNWAIMDYAVGNTPREELTGVILADGKQYPRRKPPMSPQEWPVPSKEVIQQCFGSQYIFEGLPDNLYPVSALFPDIGCDRKCDFCQTPTYSVGYKKMTTDRILEWTQAFKDAGSNSMGIWSDQFLGRINWSTGREEILEIMKGIREIGIPFNWTNGLELRKATRGRGMRDSDFSPDEELVEALWGWDGENGCSHAYIPAERPFTGRDDYAKLLPWQEHTQLMRTIVASGVAMISYGVIIGLPDDDHESLSYLEGAIETLYDELMTINPNLIFTVTPFAIAPLPGTPLAGHIRNSGLLRFEDPTILGGLWTSTADTKYMDYTEVSDWQVRLDKIGNTKFANPKVETDLFESMS